MGNWQLEVARMAMYMAFPVALFHLFNQPEYFESWVINTKKSIYPPENPKQQELLQKTIQKYQQQQQQEHLKALQELN